MALVRNLTSKIYDIKAHNSKVTSLDLGETGRVLVTGGQDRNVNLWAIGQDECFMSLTGHNRPVECVRFAYNDDFVYSADDIGIIRRWDLNAQTIYSTFNGHMKSVRTFDFNPSGEYVVSGSNDTTVRLWDVQNQNKCIKIYRGHVSHVNSVKFSPDGLWIASAGSEGSVLIWDIRKSKQIMDFTEEGPAASITCIQFHPFEFLLAVGRIDGVVCIYDLENQIRVSRTETTSQFFGHSIKCMTFSENGDCLFVGTTAGVSVIGWEPDREFDNIKGTWTALGDMKIVNKKLICGCYEQNWVSVNAVSIDRIFPFYNPSNALPVFNPNSTNRKSFSRGNQKLRLSISGNKPSRLVEENEDNRSPVFDDPSSPNYSLELVDEPLSDVNVEPVIDLSSSTTTTSLQLQQQQNVNTTSENHLLNATYATGDVTPRPLLKTTKSQLYNFASLGGSSYNIGMELGPNSLGNFNYSNGPSSLRLPDDAEIYTMEKDLDSYTHEMEFNVNDSNAPIITNYDASEMAEDFPVNQNVHQQQNEIGTTSTAGTTAAVINVSSKISKKSSFSSTTSSSNNVQKRGTHLNSAKQNFASNKLGQVSSISSMELHKLDDNMIIKKSASSHLVVNKNKRSMPTSQTQLNKENTRSKNITVQIVTKPPIRSRTSLDMRSNNHNHQSKAQERHSQAPMTYRPDLIPTSGRNPNRNIIDDQYNDIHRLSSSHELVFQELSNRNASLQLLRNSTRSHDLIGALKQSTKMSGRSVFVDLLGAILEKPSSWNLDLCLFLLPEIYELLQSQHKFHFTRACDTLRVILSNFLPVIQENIDPWAANGLGVDVTREDRQRKCMECQRWLLQIRSLPEMSHFGNALTQLQNMIII